MIFLKQNFPAYVSSTPIRLWRLGNVLTGNSSFGYKTSTKLRAFIAIKTLSVYVIFHIQQRDENVQR